MKSGKTLSLITIVEASDRGTRRDIARFRANFKSENTSHTDIVLAPGATFSVTKPANFIMVATNAPLIQLDYIRGAVTTTFTIKNMLIISDMSSVTGLTLRNFAVSGIDETVRFITG